MNLKFGLVSDLQMDVIHDGDIRLQAFLEECRKENVDFIVNNGDFCYPKDTSCCLCSEKNRPVNLTNSMRFMADVPKMEMLEAFNSYEKPHYHVLGNHEMDFCSKEETMELYGMQSAYYDFHMNGWHFIVLDPNYYQDSDGNIRNYYYGDYFDYNSSLPYLPQEQIKWLEDILTGCDEPTVIFSHQPLYNRKAGRGIKNFRDMDRIFKLKCNDGKNKVRICFYGHVHMDEYEIVDCIVHCCINSISYHWVGTAYEYQRFDEETERKFPNLRYVFPYKKPVFTIIELSDTGIIIRGREGEFIKPAPKEIGFDLYEVSASIKDKKFKWV